MGIFNIFQSNKNTLKRKIIKIKKDIERIIETVCDENFSVLYYGSYDIDPKYLVYWICVDSDEMKNKLKNDNALNKQLRYILIQNEYPTEAIELVHLGFESEETVKRDSNGDWYTHFK